MKRLFRYVDDKSVYAFAILNPLFAIPQAYNVWFGDCSGVAFSTWLMFLLSTLSWFRYGLKNGLKPIIVSRFIWLVVILLVLTGLIYKRFILGTV